MLSSMGTGLSRCSWSGGIITVFCGGSGRVSGKGRDLSWSLWDSESKKSRPGGSIPVAKRNKGQWRKAAPSNGEVKKKTFPHSGPYGFPSGRCSSTLLAAHAWLLMVVETWAFRGEYLGDKVKSQYWAFDLFPVLSWMLQLPLDGHLRVMWPWS